MRIFYVLIGILLLISCNTTTKKEELAVLKASPSDEPALAIYTAEPFYEKPKVCSEPYQLTYTINKLEDSFYELELQMNLKGDAHFVSPNSKINYKGRFTLNIKADENLVLVGKLNENPLSKEEIDNHPFVRGPVNWVRENTTYTQSLKVSTKEDFHVLGHIQFTIEPRCTLEVIPIIIKQKDGKLVVERDLC